MGAAGPAGATGPAGPSGTLGKSASVQTLNLVNGSNQVLATLTAAPNGGGSLTFFDSNGKRYLLVGVKDDGTQAGLEAFDGNTLASGNGVLRTAFGIAGNESPYGSGFGMFVRGADGATPRVAIGSSLDGTTYPSFVNLYDSSGTVRTGVQVNPCTNFVGFFTGIYPTNPTNSDTTCSTGSTGANESLIGNAYDNSASYSILYDSSGNVRNAIQYNPSANFNGFLSQDGAGDTLSVLGNALTATSSVQANESFMQLLDTNNLRLSEFQNSTNQGGLDFNPGGAIDSNGGWGNP